MDLHSPIGGIRLKSIVGICIAICVVILIVNYVQIWVADSSTEELIQETKDSIEAQSCAISLERSSDTLTECVRLFVARREPEYMWRYFDEIESGSREQMAARLEELYGETYPDTVARLKNALWFSHELEKTEVHAMRLIAESMSLNEASMPQRVAEWQLSDEEKELGRLGLISVANELVFGTDYLDTKHSIENNIADTVNLVTQHMTELQNVRGDALDRTFTHQRFTTLFMMLLVGLMAFMVGSLVMYPVSEHVRAIRSGTRWRMLGAYELRYLALIYNQIYDKNELIKDELEYRAGHDSLTGLLNRDSFERMHDALENRYEDVALILADINEFKKVNDARGHRASDDTIRRTAKLLSEFAERHNSSASRIGGDEFAIILRGARSDSFHELEEELAKINETLDEPEGAVPPISISAGIAYSEGGYNPALFQQADTAMYYAKKHGLRAGCVYKPWMDGK